MTEEDAKLKWCPFARQSVTIDSTGGPVNGPVAGWSANRFKENEGSLCFASGCMAWRETRAAVKRAVMDIGRDAPTGRRRIAEPAHGYCGLAGQPSCN